MTRLEFAPADDHHPGQAVHIARDGDHYYELRGALGQWRVFYSDGADVFKPPTPIGSTHPSHTAAETAARDHLASRLAADE